MNRSRWLLLLVGPLGLVGGSMALTHCLRGESLPLGDQQNRVWLWSDGAVESNSTPSFEECAPPAEAATDEAFRTASRAIAEDLTRKLGDHGAVIERTPLVLAGDLTAEQLAVWHDHTIAPATRAMRARYFTGAIDQPVTILLFSDEKTYNHYSKEWYGDAGVSVYGYYKPGRHTLVMNIATGGGTLVHELTHAIAHFDFPRIPDWFNEGLASLHEQCRFREAEDGPWIEGLENWRLPILQEAIQKARLRPLKSLIADNDFREKNVGVNYAQARYFCLYMQRQGVLAKYYSDWRATRAADPLGLKAIEGVFPNQSWEDLDRDFKAWALTLKR